MDVSDDFREPDCPLTNTRRIRFNDEIDAFLGLTTGVPCTYLLAYSVLHVQSSRANCTACLGLVSSFVSATYRRPRPMVCEEIASENRTSRLVSICGQYLTPYSSPFYADVATTWEQSAKYLSWLLDSTSAPPIVRNEDFMMGIMI